MADFNVNLSGPQGAGAGAIQPVQERVVQDDHTILNGLGNIFAKGLQSTRKEEAEGRKTSVIKEYVNNEKVYSDAMVTGQWNASQTGMASRANFTKILAAYPEYAADLMEAKRAVYDGTEIGEAQKEEQRAVALREGVKKNAADKGYVFYSGMGKKAEDATIDAFNYSQRVQAEVEEERKRAAEDRAVRADGRADATHEIAITEYRAKETATQGLVMIADKNFASLGTKIQDLMTNPMTFEAKQAILFQERDRLNQGLQAISASNPALAAPWQKLVNDMLDNGMKMLDPKGKAEGEAATLKAQFDTIMYKAKIAAVSDPEMRQLVVGSSLFGQPELFTMAGHAKITSWLAGAGSGEASHKPPAMVGTKDEKATLKTLQGAISNLQSGKVPDKEKATQEAVNASNEVLKQTVTQNGGSISPAALKDLSTFYSSTEFGILAASGKLDMPTMQGAKQVFQVSYEPAVRTAVLDRLNETITRSPGRDGGNRGQPVQKVIDTVDIKFSGSGVSFVDKKGSSQTISSSFTRDGLDKAAAGLNTLIRMGAHMEGTTDYGKYWEDNKHHLVPTVFPDPVKLKVGQVVKAKNGKQYKYLGGNFNDIAGSYMEVPSAQSGE